MAERLGNIGYFGLKKETTPYSAVTPDDFIPLYSENISTKLNLIDDNPVAGNRFARYQVLQGQRSHGGDFTVFAEANTTAKLLDMILRKASTSGSGPYTHTFDFGADSNTYTVDISTGNHVFRMIGVKAKELSGVLEENQQRWKIKCAGVKSFYGREIASIATNVLTLTTAYDPAPTTGLITGDLVRIVKADGSVVDTTVSSVTGTTVTVASAGSGVAAGDFIHLRPATVAFNLKSALLFALTEYRFGATASAALSAAHTPVENDSDFTIIHDFEDDEGAKRSGSFDPAALVRTQGNLKLKVKKFFDTPEEVKNFTGITKRALVIRMFSDNSVNEVRFTFNNIKLGGGGKPEVASEDILYHELEYLASNDVTDGQPFDAKTINGLTTV